MLKQASRMLFDILRRPRNTRVQSGCRVPQHSPGKMQQGSLPVRWAELLVTLNCRHGLNETEGTPSSPPLAMPMRPGLRVPVRLQIFTAQVQGQTRVDAWIWAGSDAPQWRYSRESPPPITTQQRAQEAHEARKSLVRDALMEGGSRGAAIRAGMKRGVHYLELIEPIKQLKRENRLEALTLATKPFKPRRTKPVGRRRRVGTRPHLVHAQAAIIHRKLKKRRRDSRA